MRNLEQDILIDYGSHWVSRENDGFYVWITGPTCSTSDSAYEHESLALARCKYLAWRNQEKIKES